MRLFIAIELPTNVKKEVGRMMSELKNQSIDGRFVNADQMHITLSFLGETDDITGVVNAMHKAADGIKPFSLHLGDYSYFENNQEAKTSIVNVKGDLKQLNNLYNSLTQTLRDEGFSTKGKKYVPHITMGRNVVHDEITTASLENIQPPMNASMSVNGIVLFESTRRGKDMIYTPLHKEKFV